MPGNRLPWTPDEDEALQINVPTWPAFLIAHLLGRSATAVRQRAKKLGIEKHPDHWRNPMAYLWNGTRHPNSIASRIKPGNVPANKGLRRPGWSPGRMAETQFKKGRRAEDARNYVPIGTEKVDSKRGVLVRKITDDPAIFPVMRWRAVHVLAWEAAHGPVPDGHICIFRPGQKTFDATLITPDRLELVTYAENMRRNSYHTRFPPELRQIVQLRGALTRKINNRSKRKAKA